MDITAFNKYKEIDTETNKEFRQPLDASNHDNNPDRHLIGDTIPAPSIVPYAISASVGSIGISPFAAREDHIHPYTAPDPYVLPGSVSFTNVTITGRLALPNGTSLAPSLYFTNDVDCGMYRQGSNISFVRGGIELLNLGNANEISTTLNFRTWGGFYIQSGLHAVARTLVGCRSVSSDSGNALNLNSPSQYIIFNNWVRYLSPPTTGTTSGYRYLMRNTSNNIIYEFTSSREVKEDIKPMTGYAQIIDGLNPVTFREKAKIKDEDEQTKKWREADYQYGFIAEEVAEVEPLLANWDLEKWKPISWDMSSVLAVAVAELKSLRERVAILEDQLSRKAAVDAKRSN